MELDCCTPYSSEMRGCTVITLTTLASVALGAPHRKLADPPTDVHGDGTGFCTAPTGPSACYTLDNTGNEVLINGCKCHASCATCGYGSDQAPFLGASGSNDCITCPDGSTPTAVHGDGTGFCTAKTGPSECMGPGNVKIADCKCDAGCATCGYGMPNEPFQGASSSNDCITCADDSSSAGLAHLISADFVVPAEVGSPVAYYALDEGTGFELRESISGAAAAGKVIYDTAHQTVAYDQPNWVNVRRPPATDVATGVASHGRSPPQTDVAQPCVSRCHRL